MKHNEIKIKLTTIKIALVNTQYTCTVYTIYTKGPPNILLKFKYSNKIENALITVIYLKIH